MKQPFKGKVLVKVRPVKPVLIDFNVFKLSLCCLFKSPIADNREREVDTLRERKQRLCLRCNAQAEVKFD